MLHNCVGYAYGRFNEIGGWGSCKYLRPVNAENFIQYKGDLEVGTEPRLGACMVWQKGATLTGSDGAGHVAIVEKIISSTEIVTSESGWGAAKPFWTQTRKKETDGNWGQGTGYKFLGFIYNPAVSAGGTSGGGAAYTVGKSNEETIFNFCREVLGLNVAASVGVLANIGPESNFQTGALGDGGTSYGICQWHAGRYTNLKNWCNANGKDYTTLDGQMWYMKYELEGSYSAVLSYLRSVPNTAQGAYDAAYRWCLKFEIPADTVATSEKRGAIARDTYWPKYSGTGTTTTASASTSGNTTTGTTEKRATDAARSKDTKLTGTYAVTADAGLHIRNGAGIGKASLAVLPKGTKVQNYGYYTEVSGITWLYVQVTYNGVKYTGFCSAQYLSKV